MNDNVVSLSGQPVEAQEEAREYSFVLNSDEVLWFTGFIYLSSLFIGVSDANGKALAIIPWANVKYVSAVDTSEYEFIADEDLGEE